MGGGSETVRSAQVIGLSKEFGKLKKKIFLNMVSKFFDQLVQLMTIPSLKPNIQSVIFPSTKMFIKL